MPGRGKNSLVEEQPGLSRGVFLYFLRRTAVTFPFVEEEEEAMKEAVDENEIRKPQAEQEDNGQPEAVEEAEVAKEPSEEEEAQPEVVEVAEGAEEPNAEEEEKPAEDVLQQAIKNHLEKEPLEIAEVEEENQRKAEVKAIRKVKISG
ncbi:unnamed protein product [Heligmosomoides polygyrus]|uniref:Fibrous sheath CABYR-binding protein-like n=1 Tax=Heligmosomoides polygyrus TaxID=6339 RepID=A0A183FI09_HELPZ|nr:unnamed protein product [Heligmosomoides polygyrus]